ncbi:FAD-binding oxidoreductase, partial [Thioalkalivibrio sp.]|uniref:FAD-binding oxidoreductase n=1 Tax=Thioalkalivibrio sp. TaxID=2093813 RepID=UPI0012D4EF1B
MRLIEWRDRTAPLSKADAPFLALGNGRSQGDDCLNDDGTLLLTRSMDRLIAFDRGTGIVDCEAGILLGDLLRWCLPQGWMLPVVPGTRFITVGGAVANDVHGRNHRGAGSFGRHVLEMDLLRSTGEHLRIGPTEQADLFAATIGGLGLTGLITRVRLRMIPVSSDLMLTEGIRFGHLDAFWDINDRLGAEWPYTIARIDCVARGRRLGRGVFVAGRHAPPQPAGTRLPRWRDRSR